MNQFSNGYLAYGANPVSLADPLGLTVNFLKGGNGGTDAPTERERGDAFERGYIGGGGNIGYPSDQVHIDLFCMTA